MAIPTVSTPVRWDEMLQGLGIGVVDDAGDDVALALHRADNDVLAPSLSTAG